VIHNMKAYTEPRSEGGWTVRIKTDKVDTIRYVIPAGDKFRMVNPYDMTSPQGIVCESFESAIEEAKKTVDK